MSEVKQPGRPQGVLNAVEAAQCVLQENAPSDDFNNRSFITAMTQAVNCGGNTYSVADIERQLQEELVAHRDFYKKLGIDEVAYATFDIRTLMLFQNRFNLGVKVYVEMPAKGNEGFWIMGWRDLYVAKWGDADEAKVLLLGNYAVAPMPAERERFFVLYHTGVLEFAQPQVEAEPADIENIDRSEVKYRAPISTRSIDEIYQIPPLPAQQEDEQHQEEDSADDQVHAADSEDEEMKQASDAAEIVEEKEEEAVDDGQNSSSSSSDEDGDSSETDPNHGSDSEDEVKQAEEAIEEELEYDFDGNVIPRNAYEVERKVGALPFRDDEKGKSKLTLSEYHQKYFEVKDGAIRPKKDAIHCEDSIDVTASTESLLGQIRDNGRTLKLKGAVDFDTFVLLHSLSDLAKTPGVFSIRNDSSVNKISRRSTIGVRTREEDEGPFTYRPVHKLANTFIGTYTSDTTYRLFIAATEPTIVPARNRFKKLLAEACLQLVHEEKLPQVWAIETFRGQEAKSNIELSAATSGRVFHRMAELAEERPSDFDMSTCVFVAIAAGVRKNFTFASFSELTTGLQKIVEAHPSGSYRRLEIDAGGTSHAYETKQPDDPHPLRPLHLLWNTNYVDQVLADLRIPATSINRFANLGLASHASFLARPLVINQATGQEHIRPAVRLKFYNTTLQQFTMTQDGHMSHNLCLSRFNILSDLNARILIDLMKPADDSLPKSRLKRQEMKRKAQESKALLQEAARRKQSRALMESDLKKAEATATEIIGKLMANFVAMKEFPGEPRVELTVVSSRMGSALPALFRIADVGNDLPEQSDQEVVGKYAVITSADFANHCMALLGLLAHPLINAFENIMIKGVRAGIDRKTRFTFQLIEQLLHNVHSGDFRSIFSDFSSFLANERPRAGDLMAGKRLSLMAAMRDRNVITLPKNRIDVEKMTVLFDIPSSFRRDITRTSYQWGGKNRKEAVSNIIDLSDKAKSRNIKACATQLLGEYENMTYHILKNAKLIDCDREEYDLSVDILTGLDEETMERVVTEQEEAWGPELFRRLFNEHAIAKDALLRDRRWKWPVFDMYLALRKQKKSENIDQLLYAKMSARAPTSILRPGNYRAVETHGKLVQRLMPGSADVPWNERTNDEQQPEAAAWIDTKPGQQTHLRPLVPDQQAPIGIGFADRPTGGDLTAEDIKKINATSKLTGAKAAGVEKRWNPVSSALLGVVYEAAPSNATCLALTNLNSGFIKRGPGGKFILLKTHGQLATEGRKFKVAMEAKQTGKVTRVQEKYLRLLQAAQDPAIKVKLDKAKATWINTKRGGEGDIYSKVLQQDQALETALLTGKAPRAAAPAGGRGIKRKASDSEEDQDNEGNKERKRARNGGDRRSRPIDLSDDD